MKRYGFRSLFGFFFVALLVLGASQATSAASIRVEGTVKTLQTWEGHSGYLIKMSDMSMTKGQCERNDWFILPLSHMYAKDNFSMLLAARLAEKEIVLILREGESVERFPRVYHMFL